MKRQVLKTGGWGWIILIVSLISWLWSGTCDQYVQSIPPGVTAKWSAIAFKTGFALRGASATLSLSLLIAEVALRIYPKQHELKKEHKLTLMLLNLAAIAIFFMLSLGGDMFQIQWFPLAAQAAVNTASFYALGSPRQKEAPEE